MLRYDLLIVGAGVSGLTVASTVGRHGSVCVIDRLPALGGVLGYEHPIIRRLGRGVQAANVDLLLGTTALRWNNDRLLVAGERGIEWLAAGELVFCGGTRPSTAAELKIAGDRPAGVLLASVAIHMMEAGVRLGNAVVVVGSSDWSRRAADHLKVQGARISTVVERSDAALGEEAWLGWRLEQVHGTARVSHVTVARSGFRQRINCDAVVLGARVRPLRNVLGAVLGDSQVAFVQPVGETTSAEDVEAHALQAAARLLDSLGGRG
jgi:glycine/D-amino acid oxidase-like deaminating enzyme